MRKIRFLLILPLILLFLVTPVLADGLLYLRHETAVVCLDLRGRGKAPVQP